MTDMQKWYKKTVKDDSVNAAAKKSGIVQSTLNRYDKTGHFPAEAVILIARAYGTSPIRALVQTGHLTQKDVDEYRTLAGLSGATDKEIAAEVMRRLSDDNLEE